MKKIFISIITIITVLLFAAVGFCCSNNFSGNGCDEEISVPISSFSNPRDMGLCELSLKFPWMFIFPACLAQTEGSEGSEQCLWTTIALWGMLVLMNCPFNDVEGVEKISR